MGCNTRSGLTWGTRGRTLGQLVQNLHIPHNCGAWVLWVFFLFEFIRRQSRPLVSRKPESEMPDSKQLLFTNLLTRPDVVQGRYLCKAQVKIPCTPRIHDVGFFYLPRRDSALSYSLVWVPLCRKTETSTSVLWAWQRNCLENSYQSYLWPGTLYSNGPVHIATIYSTTNRGKKFLKL